VRDKADHRSELKSVETDLRRCGIEGVLSDNITRDALVKFSYVSAAGACGLYYNAAAGEIKKPGECRDCFVNLVKEVESLGGAMGIKFEEDLADRNLKILNGLSDDTTTSMQRDVYANRKSEIDGLIYEVVRLGRQYKIPLPEYEKIADEMKARGLA
ncbi:MAG: 2-dehydropantoate 2-reductase, partial [Lachnospiraceae bacterium]|nr:2-dehydropantoate 2-reductase [Lachnospiraceae bacterium]